MWFVIIYRGIVDLVMSQKRFVNVVDGTKLKRCSRLEWLDVIENILKERKVRSSNV